MHLAARFKIETMDTTELENKDKKDGSVVKGASHIIVELVEYEHNASVSKSIMKKTTGSINAVSFDTGEGLNEKTSPYDTYAQVIEGDAVVVVEGKESKLNVGEGIIIPAHKLNYVKPNGRFKMLLTVIKSAYED
jgi:quercetin dioxygenase-like cupin family protein